jgi:hypothetical protein
MEVDTLSEIIPGAKVRRTPRPDQLNRRILLNFEQDVSFRPTHLSILAVDDQELVGAHAYPKTSQYIVLLQGAATALLDNGHSRRAVRLTFSGQALLVPPAVWGGILGSAAGTLVAVLCSEQSLPADCITNYAEFRQRFAV